MKLAATVVLSVLAFSVFAQQSKSLNQMRTEEALQKAIDTLNELDAKVTAMTNQRRIDCMKAVGYEPFCACVLNELPVAWNFSDYVAITTRGKEENGYTKMSAELRSAYDKVEPIRDKCVNAINVSP